MSGTNERKFKGREKRKKDIRRAHPCDRNVTESNGTEVNPTPEDKIGAEQEAGVEPLVLLFVFRENSSD